MGDELNDVYFDDDEFDSVEGQQTTELQPIELQTTELQQTPEDNDLTSEILRLKGIKDPEKIKFEDETGTLIERSWDSLSRQEQINILMNQEQQDNGLYEDELQLINEIRNSGLTANEYLQSLLPQVETVKRYQIDELSDDELYALDLLHKAGSDISDEEINLAIETAKQNENLYKKTVEGLRKEYIRLLEEEENQMENERYAQQEAAYNRFSNTIMNLIQNLNSFAGQSLELSNEDVEELSSFMLDIDDSGMSAFGRAMNDPSLFTKAAFWILNEDKIVEELNKQIQDNYRRGYELAKRDLQNKSKLVVNNTSPRKTTDDVFIEDEDW